VWNSNRSHPRSRKKLPFLARRTVICNPRPGVTLENMHIVRRNIPEQGSTIEESIAMTPRDRNDLRYDFPKACFYL
jgi:hypothetical protein